MVGRVCHRRELPVIRDVAAETVLTVLLPYSPLQVTGCTIMVRKSECIDLNITFEQACQFIVSCGVVVPPICLRASGARQREQSPGRSRRETA